MSLFSSQCYAKVTIEKIRGKWQYMLSGVLNLFLPTWYKEGINELSPIMKKSVSQILANNFP